MEITAANVKELRNQTGAGVMECKRALVEARGNIDAAIEILRRQGLDRADRKAGRPAQQGVVDSYIHAGGRIGAMVEVNCETDFVARTDDFRQLAHDIAMQVAAMSPRYVRPDEVVAGDAPEEQILLKQPFIKDPKRTIDQLI